MKKYLLLISIFLTSCSVVPYDGLEREVYYVKSNGAELPVIISGKNTKNIILYVHGGPGCSSLQQFYAPIFERFKKDYRVVFYDQRGSGGARGHITEASMTVDQHVEDLDAVINSVLAKYPDSSIYMIGGSYGGMIAGAYTSIYQDKLKGIIFIAPALNVEDMSTRIPAHVLEEFIDPYLARTDISGEDRKYWKEAQKFYQNNIPLKLDSFLQHNSYVSKAYRIHIPELAKFDTYNEELLAKLLADPILESLIIVKQISLMLPILDHNKESQRNLVTDPKFRLSKITIPTILFLGDKDLTVPPISSENAFNTIGSDPSDKKIIKYKGVGHDPFIQHSETLQKDIITFINANP